MQVRVLLLCLALLSACQVYSQSVDWIKTQGITSELHRANIGKICFTNQSITPADLKQTDFLSSYELTNKSNLFMTVFMGTSLTN